MTDFVGPFEWFSTPNNYQGMVFAYGAAFVAAVGAANLNGAVWTTALIGIASAFMFTTISVPFAALYYGFQWPWWIVSGAFWGFVSIIAMRSIIKGALRVEQRTNDIVDGGIRRVLPSTPEGERHV